MDIVKRIASMMRPYRKTMVMVFALQLIVILTRLIVPIITETIVNDVITAGNLTIVRRAFIAGGSARCVYLRPLGLQ